MNVRVGGSVWWFGVAVLWCVTLGEVRAQVPGIHTQTTKRNVAVTVVPAPTAPLAVVLLSAAVPDAQLSPSARAQLTLAAQVLADGQGSGVDLNAIEAKPFVHVDGDRLVVALVGPHPRVDDMLRAIDARVRRRMQLRAPTQRADTLPVLAPAPLFAESAYLFAGAADAMPVDSGDDVAAVLPQTLRTLEVVLSQGLQVVVVANMDAELLQKKAQSLLTFEASITAPAPTSALVGQASVGVRSSEKATLSPKTSGALLMVCDAPRPSVAVLAALLGAEERRSASSSVLRLRFEVERASLAFSAEQALIKQVYDVAQAPPPVEAVERAKQNVKDAWAKHITRPEQLAFFVVEHGAVDDAWRALEATTENDVKRAAQACTAGARLLAKDVGTTR